MNAAIAVTKMDHVRKGSAGAATEDSRKKRFYVRDVGDSQAQLTDNAQQGSVLKEGKRYGKREDLLMDCIDAIS